MSEQITQIILPSNNAKYSTENQIGQFKCNLNQKMVCEADEEIGLAEISYTFSWYNINTKQKIKIVDADTRSVSYNGREMAIFPGRYDDIDELVNMINKLLSDNMIPGDRHEPPQLEVIRNARKLKIKAGTARFANLEEEIPLTVVFDAEIESLLGLEGIHSNFGFNDIIVDKWADTDAYNIVPNTFVALNAYDLTAGIHALYVYCNIVKHTFVGDTSTQLLRMVEVPNNLPFGVQVVKEYHFPQYRSPSVSEFYEVEIAIKDGTGSDIKFQFGSVILTLYKRQRDG